MKVCGLGYNESQLLEFLKQYKEALAQSEYSVKAQKDNIKDIETRLELVRQPEAIAGKTLAEEIETIKTFGFDIQNYKVVNNTHVRIKNK